MFRHMLSYENNQLHIRPHHTTLFFIDSPQIFYSLRKGVNNLGKNSKISQHIMLSNVSACYSLCDAAVSNGTVKANDIMCILL